MTPFPTIAEAARLIAARKLSPVELTRHCLDRIEALDGTLHSFILPTPERALADARAAGLDIVDLRDERLQVVFEDVGAVAYFLRKVLWTVPGFTIGGYRPELLRLHRLIEREGTFVSHSRRLLVEARQPGEEAARSEALDLTERPDHGHRTSHDQ